MFLHCFSTDNGKKRRLLHSIINKRKNFPFTTVLIVSIFNIPSLSLQLAKPKKFGYFWLQQLVTSFLTLAMFFVITIRTKWRHLNVSFINIPNSTAWGNMLTFYDGKASLALMWKLCIYFRFSPFKKKIGTEIVLILQLQNDWKLYIPIYDYLIHYLWNFLKNPLQTRDTKMGLPEPPPLICFLCVGVGFDPDMWIFASQPWQRYPKFKVLKLSSDKGSGHGFIWQLLGFQKWNSCGCLGLTFSHLLPHFLTFTWGFTDLIWSVA